MLDVLKRMKESQVQFVGSLSFVNNWTFFANAEDFGQLTKTGPYAGTFQYVS